MRDVVARHFRGKTSFRFDGGDHWRSQFAALSQTERDSLDLIEGHQYYGVHALLSRPAAYITMLREPVDRVLSFYFYVRGEPTHYLHPWFGDGRTLRDAIEHQASRELDNFQTRLLTTERNVKLPFGRVDRAMLEEAKEHLNGFAGVGLTERFDESLALFALAFGWPDLVYERFKKDRSRPRASDMDPKLIDLVRETNRMDVELYEFACKLVQTRIDRAGSGFTGLLARIRDAQARHDAAQRPTPPEPGLAVGVWRV